MNLQSVTININLSLLHEIGAGQAAKLERRVIYPGRRGRPVLGDYRPSI